MHRIAWLTFAGLSLAVAAAAARTPPVACTGRFAIAAEDARFLGDGSPDVNWLEIDAGGGVVLDACGAATARVRVKRRATVVRASWAACHAATRVVVRARIPSPACQALSGTVKRKGAKRVRFGAVVSTVTTTSIAPSTTSTTSIATSTTAIDTSTTSTTASTTTSTSMLPDGPPIVATPGTWTWVDVPDAVCDDGSPTGIGVNLADSPNVIIMLGFGGLCWDAITCWVENSAAHGPVGKAQFEAVLASAPGGDILDRMLPGNPFATWNLVAVPYCTGDLHAGDNVVVYDTGEALHTHHHAGRANLLAYLRRLGPTFPSPGKVVLAGMSAGGFGSLLDFPTIRARWPAAHAYVMDDSGPLLESASFDAEFIANWFSNWRLDLTTDPICAGPCRSDLSLVVSALADQYPTDRIALISSVQDLAGQSIFGLTGPEYETALLDLAVDRFDPTTNARYFFTAGDDHVLTLDPASVMQSDVSLLEWLTAFVTDDPAWTSVQP